MADDFLNDDDIIDLTELIEKGKDPADSLPPLSEQGPMNEGSDKDAITDLDALLAQIDPQTENASNTLTPEQVRSPNHKIDTQEQLDMGGMDEVDKLLDILDIPPQPGPEQATRTADPSPALDNAVDALLAAAQPAAAQPAASSDLEKDLDAIMADVDGPVAAESAPAAPTPDPTADLDTLLETVASTAPTSPTPAPADPTADLDALLAAAQNSVPEPAPAPQMDPTTDLGALLAAAPTLAEPSPVEPAAVPDVAPVADPMADLDALLQAAPPVTAPESVSTPGSAPMPEAIAEPVTEPDPAADLVADLDAMLAATASEPAPASDVAPAPGSDPAAGIDALMAMAKPEPTPAEASAEVPAEAADDALADMEALMAAAAADPAPTDEVPAEVPQPDAMPEMELPIMEMQDIPGETAATETLETMPGDIAMPDMPDVPEASAELATEPAEPVEEALPDVIMEDVADVPEGEAFAGDVELPADVPAELTFGSEIMPETEMSEDFAMPVAQGAAPAETIPQPAGASFEELLDESSPLHDRFTALIASAVTSALQNNAEVLAAQPHATPQVPMPDMDGLTARFDAIEARLDQLASAGEANAAAFANVPVQLQEFAGMPAQLQDMEIAAKSAAARMDAIEQRLDALEPRFNAEVEKAAANAAARILREEIAKLLQA